VLSRLLVPRGFVLRWVFSFTVFSLRYVQAYFFGGESHRICTVSLSFSMVVRSLVRRAESFLFLFEPSRVAM